MKALFSDLEFKNQYGLGAVNSINWARIMFQITYYFYTYYKLFPQCDGSISFTVPTGNFGDILAGYYAKCMGLPVRNLVAATNSNDIVHRFFSTGKYDKEVVQATTSPSMDIGISSNLERYFYYLLDSDAAQCKENMEAFKETGKMHMSQEKLKRAEADFASASASEQQVDEAIKAYADKHDYVLCPHTACGVVAVEQVRDRLEWQSLSNHQVVVLGTAHPAKFTHAVENAMGKPPVMPNALAAAQIAKTRCQSLPNSEQKVREAIEESVKLSSAPGPGAAGYPEKTEAEAPMQAEAEGVVQR